VPLTAAIVTLGWLAGCAGPAPPLTGPPHLVLVLADQAPTGLALTPVFPVAADPDAHRVALMTGTWPGFAARHELVQVLLAVGYEVLTAPTDVPATAPRFTLTAGGGMPSPGPHTLQITVGLDPDQPFLVLSGDAAPVTVTGPATLLDVMPTLLAAAGTVAPAGSPGRDLGDPAASLPDAWFQLGPDGTWIARTPDQTLAWTGELQALAEAPLDDPRLTWVPAERPPSETLRAAMVRWQVSKAQDPSTPPLDPALQQVLQQRGYW
jgi:hypothetical protein